MLIAKIKSSKIFIRCLKLSRIITFPMIGFFKWFYQRLALDEMLGHMASIVNNYSIKLDIFSKDKAARKWLGFSSIQGLFQSRKALIGLY